MSDVSKQAQFVVLKLPSGPKFIVNSSVGAMRKSAMKINPVVEKKASTPNKKKASTFIAKVSQTQTKDKTLEMPPVPMMSPD